MAKNKTKNTEADILEEGSAKLSNAFSNAEYFFEQYKNLILGVLVVLIVGIGGWWGYNNFVKGPKEAKAKDAIVFAQKYFEIDSMSLALKGDGMHLGFEAIAKQYSGTAAGNRALFGAGIASLKLGKFADAIKYLEDCKPEEGLLNARKFGGIGDAYAEQNQMDKAIENYKKAVDASDNETTAPVYLYRQALVLEQKGNKTEALDAYKKLVSNYPGTDGGIASQLNALSQIKVAKLEAQSF